MLIYSYFVGALEVATRVLIIAACIKYLKSH